MLRSTNKYFKYAFKHSKLKSLRLFHSPNVSVRKPITLKEEVQILQFISQKTLDPFENINNVIDLMKPKDVILSNKVCESAILHVLEKIQGCTDNEIKNKYIKKLSEILLICLRKYYKNDKYIDGIVKNKTFFITYNMIDQDRIFEIIKVLNTCSIKNDIQTANEILYKTIPLLYKYYYQTYTWNFKYKDYNGETFDDIYVKLPKTNAKEELRQLIALNRHDNDFDLITYNYRYNNFEQRGSGKKSIPNIEYEFVKQLPKVEMARKSFVPMKLNENLDDTYVEFADYSTRTKLNAKFKTFISLQLLQSETTAKRYLMYLLNDKGNNELSNNEIFLVLAQLSHHLDRIVNMDGHQYRHKKNSSVNYLLNDIKINDYPNLAFILKNSKALVKEYILKQLHYKVLKKKMLSDLKIKKYLPKIYQNCDLLEDGEIVEAKGEFEVLKLPYRHLTKAERTNTKHKKNEQLVLLDYYPRILISIVNKDGNFVYKYNTTFKTGYKRLYKKTKLIKKSKLHYLDHVQQSNLKFNKVFNPNTTKTKIFRENIIMSRNLFMTKILLKFLCVDKDGKLLISLDSPEDVNFLNETIALLEMFLGDPIFDDVNHKYEEKSRLRAKNAMQFEKMQNLLLQFLEKTED